MYQAQEKSGRQSRRLEVPLAVVLSSGKAHYFIEAENLSEKGLCLRPKRNFPVGAQYRMAFGMPPSLPRISAVGTIRWSKTDKGVGVEFSSISSNDAQTLQQFLNSQSGPWQA
ncbi:MAG: PilZ domain-containing protein [Terriglobia bacterium]